MLIINTWFRLKVYAKAQRMSVRINIEDPKELNSWRGAFVSIEWQCERIVQT